VLILLDEQLPRQLAPHLKEHDARTVKQQGWAGLKNGELLRAAVRAGFEVFLTSDQNLEYQQNLQKAELFVAVLVARSNKLDDLLPLLPDLLAALRNTSISAGDLIRIGI
jgi:predicted nuclease of predicted toxin-antitoxin system